MQCFRHNADAAVAGQDPAPKRELGDAETPKRRGAPDFPNRGPPPSRERRSAHRGNRPAIPLRRPGPEAGGNSWRFLFHDFERFRMIARGCTRAEAFCDPAAPAPLVRSKGSGCGSAGTRTNGATNALASPIAPTAPEGALRRRSRGRLGSQAKIGPIRIPVAIPAPPSPARRRASRTRPHTIQKYGSCPAKFLNISMDWGGRRRRGVARRPSRGRWTRGISAGTLSTPPGASPLQAGVPVRAAGRGPGAAGDLRAVADTSRLSSAMRNE
jgi:hypothetical protein